MNVNELLSECSSKKLLIHKDQVFFNEWDSAEVERFRALGCQSIPWYTEEEIQWRKVRGYPTRQGWEIHLLGACDPIYEENEDGDEVNITAAFLLSCARDRVAA